MGFIVCSYEKLEIKNTTKGAKEISKALSDYIKQFYDKKSIEDVYSMDGKLSIDGKEYTDPRAIHVFSSNFDKAKDISFEIYFSIMQSFGDDYGYSYWSKLLNEDAKRLTKHVSYKCLEYYDSNEDVVAYNFGTDFIGDVSYDAKREDVARVNEWYCNSFSLVANLNDSFIKEALDDLMGLAMVLNFKYEFFNKIEAPIDNEFRICDEVFIRKSLESFIYDLQRTIDCISSASDKIHLHAILTPDICNDFSAVEISLDGTKVVAKYCSFN